MIEYEVYQCLGLNRVKMYYTLKVLQTKKIILYLKLIILPISVCVFLLKVYLW